MLLPDDEKAFMSAPFRDKVDTLIRFMQDIAEGGPNGCRLSGANFEVSSANLQRLAEMHLKKLAEKQKLPEDIWEKMAESSKKYALQQKAWLDSQRDDNGQN